MALTKLDPNVIGQDSTGTGKITSAGGSVSIDSSGNVRIANSTANTYTYNINGTFVTRRAADGISYNLEGSYTGNPSIVQIGQTSSDGYVKVLSAGGDNTFIQGYAGGTSYFAGNLAIGTTTSSTKLTVNGTSYFSNTFAVGTTSPIARAHIKADTSAADTDGVLVVENGMNNGYETMKLYTTGGYNCSLSFRSNTYWIGMGIHESDGGKFKINTDNLLTAGNNILTITQAGLVGLGTTVPTTTLTIAKPIDSAAYGSGTSMIDFKSYYPGYDVTTVKASIYAGVSAIGNLNTQGGYLAFLTANDGTIGERLRIEKNGQLWLGKGSYGGENQKFKIGNHTIWGKLNDDIYIYGYGGESTGGLVYAGNYYTFSNRNLKEDIQPLVDPLTKLLQIEGVSYSLKATGRKSIGVLADRVAAVYPDLVTYNENGEPDSVDYPSLVAVLIETTRVLKNEIDELKAKVA